MSASKPKKDTFLFIPHTHWEGAVFKTREEYLEMGLPNILRAINMLKRFPEYRFVLDQACYVQPFLERHPEEEAAFRQYVQEGRLAIVGGTDTMMDGNMPGGESYVRQFLYGKEFFRQKLGVEVTTGWQLDTFGHHAQMPQLLKLAGFKSFWFFRGVPAFDGSVPSEFFWEGLDGSRIAAFWLPHAYANVYGSPKTLPEFTAFMKERFEALVPFAHGPVRAGLAGADVCEPEEHVPELIAAFNRQADAPFQLRLAVPAEFESEVAKRTDRPVVTGEMNPIFQGTYSSRIGLKQRMRELETILTDAEKFGVLLRWLGAATDDDILWRAWEPVLFNQAHDLMSGVMTDHVHEDTIRGYDFSKRTASDELTARTRALAEHIDTRGDGIPLVVYNTLGWVRTDVAIATVGFSDPEIKAVKLVGPDGRDVACQLVDAVRYADGSLLSAKVAFIARELPAMGHAVYHLTPLTDFPPALDEKSAPVLENDWYRVEVDPATGAVSKLIVKDGNWDALSGPGNVVAMEEDRGDFWELYRPLDAGSRIGMKERHEPPQPGKAVFSTGQTAEAGKITRGPVFSEFSVSHPFSGKGRFQTTIRIYAGVRRIEFHTTILNHDGGVRYRVLFPTSIRSGKSVHEIPFGAIERPEGIEFPAQNWMDWAGATHGVALLNRGLPGNNAVGGTLMLSLLRSTSIVAYGYGGGYEPGMSSDTGLELGKELSFDYALVPHGGDWRQAGIYRDGLEFNHPLMARPVAPHEGRLPNRWGFLTIDHPNVVLSAMKSSRQKSAVLRVYEASGLPARGVKIAVSTPIVSAEEVNLMEDSGDPMKLVDGALQTDLRPFEIKTFKLELKESDRLK
jgi:alpha-mannosidase